ncbi:hypothetical protein GS429_08390 [Natronorubrum sp. JWXQ-INN-674]|uniref:Uncharacterized protein n=1 Tax=Natronorubrum halalkaliphilum TaxID=2691917 RepID=A0A6B0VKM3_9EURY|nr:hypothetical protein [Natronorubrum halalkaliphilum]MXV62078.1 hypothetical protein [Natronorubrum halalkaliphilum]
MSDHRPRLRAVREMILGRLVADDQLADLLEQADVDDASDVIVPATVARTWHEDDGAPDPPDVVVHVMVRTDLEEPRNLRTEATFNVQVGFEYRPSVGRRQPTTWPDDVLGAIASVGNDRIEGWYWDGETGGTDPTFDDSINRFVAGKTFEIRRIA